VRHTPKIRVLGKRRKERRDAAGGHRLEQPG